MRLAFKILSWALLTFPAGCYPAFVFQMDGLEPAQITVTSSISSLTVFTRIDLDSSYRASRIASAGKALFLLDSTAAKEGVLGCIDELLESPRFEVFDPIIRKNLNGDFTNPDCPLPWIKILEAAGEPPVDAALALESCQVRDTVVTVVQDGFKDYAFLLILKTYWRLYDLSMNRYLDYPFIDTIKYDLWEVEELERSSPVSHYIILNGMYQIGKKTANRLAPYWIPLDRAYFPYGPPDFFKASRSMREGQWLEAATIWEQYVESDNRCQAAKACYNMAVTCELAGQIELALEWVAKAERKGMPDYYIDEYRSELKKREAKTQLLDSQMTGSQNLP